MKQWLIVTLSFTCICSNQSNAQIIKHYGVNIAITSANQNYELKFIPELQTRRRVGFNVGGFMELFNNPVLSLLAQIEYAQRGIGQDFDLTTASDPTPVGVITYYSRLDYISIPILAKARIQTQTVTPFIVAGPRLDFLLGYQSEENLFNPVYDRFKKENVGGTIGAGIQTESIQAVNIFVEFRYNIDFEDSYSTDVLTVRNNAFDIWVGVIF